jgi:hypothetical protein
MRWNLEENFKRTLTVLAFLVLAFIGIIGLNHMDPNATVARSWPPYVCVIGLMGVLILLVGEPKQRRNRPQDASDELNDNGLYGHAFGPTVPLGIDKTIKDIKAGR